MLTKITIKRSCELALLVSFNSPRETRVEKPRSKLELCDAATTVSDDEVVLRVCSLVVVAAKAEKLELIVTTGDELLSVAQVVVISNQTDEVDSGRVPNGVLKLSVVVVAT
jgi:hypothetical protein